MRNIRLLIEYDGTAYAGWQTQKNAPTIQQTLENALATMTGAKVSLAGSGRTDAGVHAQGQVANFHTDATIPLKGFVQGLNGLLPRDISIRRGDEVGEGFDSRRSSRSKTYRYRIHNSQTYSALAARTSWWVSYPLDEEAMSRAGDQLVGIYEFDAFRSSGCEAAHAIRQITALTVCREGEALFVEVTGSGFLRHMVRIIVGTLMEVGSGKREAASMEALIQGRDREQAGVTAPSQGLMLVQVVYDEPVRESYP